MFKKLAVAVAFVAAATIAHAESLRMLVPLDKSNPASPFAGDEFAKQVGEISKGALTVNVFGPETVPSFQQFEPVQAGAFDIIMTPPGYHLNVTGAGAVFEASVPDTARLRSEGLFDAIVGEYEKIGLKLIAVPVMGPGAYQIFLNDPIGPEGDLSGRKIRGSLTYKNFVDKLGGTLVSLPNAETYSALDNKVVDGAGWTSIGLETARFYEVSHYLARPKFGSTSLLFLVNLARWNSLTPDQQAMLVKAGMEVEKSYPRKAAEMAETEEAFLLTKGMKITEFGPKAGDVKKLFFDSTFAAIASTDTALAEKYRTFLESKGLQNY